VGGLVHFPKRPSATEASAQSTFSPHRMAGTPKGLTRPHNFTHYLKKKVKREGGGAPHENTRGERRMKKRKKEGSPPLEVG